LTPTARGETLMPRSAMSRNRRQFAALLLGVFALACWIVMFLSGTDVWHDLGRPDFWHRSSPPYNDLRVFVVAFYAMLAVLVALLILMAVSLVSVRLQPPGD
jgi:RsiW-degrading membrane proteinase PrsW (M82 family)